LFSREVFEPTDKELNPVEEDDEDNEDTIMISDDEDEMANYDRKGKGKAAPKPTNSRRKARRAIVESDDEGDDVNFCGSDKKDDDDDDDMSDFIVGSDEDEEEKDALRAVKKRLGKKLLHVILDSDDEPDISEEKEVIFGVRKKVPISKEAIKLMPRFLPSSKMKVCHRLFFSGTISSSTMIIQYMMDELLKLQKTNPEEKVRCCHRIGVDAWINSCPDPPCFPMDRVSLLDLRLFDRKRHSSCQVPRRYDPHQTRPGSQSIHGERKSSCHVNVAQMRRSVVTIFGFFIDLANWILLGVGLNLTRANNVISLDLGWSQAVESQAFDRVHRVGQMRKVHVQRVVIADTVEDRILKMQERKVLCLFNAFEKIFLIRYFQQTLADGSLGEGSGKKIGSEYFSFGHDSVRTIDLQHS